MTILPKEWKSKWALKSITKEELENQLKQVINKQYLKKIKNYG